MLLFFVFCMGFLFVHIYSCKKASARLDITEHFSEGERRICVCQMSAMNDLVAWGKTVTSFHLISVWNYTTCTTTDIPFMRPYSEITQKLFFL